jgi:hypothetical protein
MVSKDSSDHVNCRTAGYLSGSRGSLQLSRDTSRHGVSVCIEAVVCACSSDTMPAAAGLAEFAK